MTDRSIQFLLKLAAFGFEALFFLLRQPLYILRGHGGAVGLGRNDHHAHGFHVQDEALGLDLALQGLKDLSPFLVEFLEQGLLLLDIVFVLKGLGKTFPQGANEVLHIFFELPTLAGGKLQRKGPIRILKVIDIAPIRGGGTPTRFLLGEDLNQIFGTEFHLPGHIDMYIQIFQAEPQRESGKGPFLGHYRGRFLLQKILGTGYL